MKRFLIYVSALALSLCLIGAGTLYGLYLWASSDLPSITKLMDYRPLQVTTVYARDGSIIGYFFKEKRFPVSLEIMPEHLKNAFLAAEDARFFQHSGVDIKAILSALLNNTLNIGPFRGASTITQQLTKLRLLTPERAYERKLKEAILAYRIENYMDKNTILWMYLNEIYLGNSAHGVEAASRTYFGKHVQDLTLAESAIIASLAKAPSQVNPYQGPSQVRHRQLYVLGRMLENNFISKSEYDAAVAEPPDYKSMPDPTWKIGAWYLEEVRRELLDFLSEENITRAGVALDIYGQQALYEGGLHVYTAMDPYHQSSAEQALRKGLHEADHRRGWRGPLERIGSGDYEAYLQGHYFSPEMLDNAGWVKALVVNVSKEGAEVRLGRYHGYISVAQLAWCRAPNPKVAAAAAGQVRDATKVLFPGDVIYVAAIGADGDLNPVSVPAAPDRKTNPVPSYDSSVVTAEVTIPLSLEQMPDLQGAVASIEVDSGDVVAIVGGYQFSSQSQFNRATQALRQPGSAFKPIVYSAALDQGYTPGTTLYDTPFSLPDKYTRRVWTPGNADGKYRGPISLSAALAASRNVCTVRVAQQIGVKSVIQRAHQLGIPGKIPEVLPISLGSYEATPLVMAKPIPLLPIREKGLTGGLSYPSITVGMNNWRFLKKLKLRLFLRKMPLSCPTF